MKLFGIEHAGAAEFAVRQRLGKMQALGSGVSFLRIPILDRVTMIPCYSQRMEFAADQITRENQGIEVAGSAAWRIVEPMTSIRHFDFESPGEGLSSIGRALQDVIESAIRRQLALLSLEEALRGRGSIMKRLSDELAGISKLWGLTVDAVEIRHVKILSQRLFEQLQAGFREQVRLESEQARMQADEELAKTKAEKNAADAARAEQLKLEAIRRDRERVPVERALNADQAARDREQAEQQLAVVELQAAGQRQQLEARNVEDPRLAFVRALPDALIGANVQQLHLGESALEQLTSALTRPRIPRGGLYTPGAE